MSSSNKTLVALAEHAGSFVGNHRRLDRTKAVLPVRISGTDVSGDSYCELVHTLDVTRSGVRLGAVRRQLEVGSLIVVQYRQHRAEFRVIWTKPPGAGAEHQVGLEAVAQRDLWGLDISVPHRPQAAGPAPAIGASIGA